MSDCKKNPKDAKLVVRATDNQKTWGNVQVFECRECGERWSE